MIARRMRAAAGGLAAALLMAGAAQAAETASGEFIDREGKTIGKAELVETPSGVLITVTVAGLSPGEHGFHIHEVGKCEPPGFTSAGGHFNPHGAHHGLMSEEGPHSGDLPNLIVPETGRLTVQFWNPMVTLLTDTEDSLLDEDGSSLVIHAGPDDHLTDPAGDSGDRIACAVIK